MLRHLSTAMRVSLCFMIIALSLGSAFAATDFSDATRQNLITAKLSGMGRSYGNSILAEITNNTDQPLSLSLAAGTLLLPDNSQYPRMAARRFTGRLTGGQYVRTDEFSLAAHQTQTFVIAAYSLDFDKPDPAKETAFSPGVVDNRAKALLDAAAKANLSSAATQAAIWLKLGNITQDQITSRLTLSPAEVTAAEKLPIALPPPAPSAPPPPPAPATAQPEASPPPVAALKPPPHTKATRAAAPDEDVSSPEETPMGPVLPPGSWQQPAGGGSGALRPGSYTSKYGYLPSLEEVEASPERSYLLAQFTPLFAMAGTCEVEIVPLKDGKEGKPITISPRRAHLPSEWMAPFGSGNRLFLRSQGAKKDDRLIAALLFAPLKPARYILSRYRLNKGLGSKNSGSYFITRSAALDAPLGITFEITPGKISYVGSFAFSVPSKPGSDEYLPSFTGPYFPMPGTGTFTFGGPSVQRDTIDDLPAALAVLEAWEPGLGKEIEKRVVKAENLSGATLSSSELERKLKELIEQLLKKKD